MLVKTKEINAKYKERVNGKQEVEVKDFLDKNEILMLLNKD